MRVFIQFSPSIEMTTKPSVEYESILFLLNEIEL